MKREKMIEKLVNDDIATIKSAMYNNDYEYLSNCLQFGLGYDSWLDEDLKQEFNTRTWEEA